MRATGFPRQAAAAHEPSLEQPHKVTSSRSSCGHGPAESQAPVEASPDRGHTEAHAPPPSPPRPLWLSLLYQQPPPSGLPAPLEALQTGSPSHVPSHTRVGTSVCGRTYVPGGTRSGVAPRFVPVLCDVALRGPPGTTTTSRFSVQSVWDVTAASGVCVRVSRGTRRQAVARA